MTTDEDAELSTTDYIGQDTSNVYLKLEVPDYEQHGSNLALANKYSSLKLGDNDEIAGWTSTGTSGSAIGTTGDDLLDNFGGFTDDTRLRETLGTFKGEQATPPSEENKRSGSDAPYSALVATDADATSAEALYPQSDFSNSNVRVSTNIPSYVGWRDHTDGHRISTTRGDKIEIVAGNYKLVSLGRGTGVASLEMSGGLIIDGDEAPGGISSVTAQACPTTDATGWKVVEQSATANVVERFHGTFREEFYGDEIIRVVGSPDQDTDPARFMLGVSDRSDVSNNGSEAFVDTKSNRVARPTKWDETGSVLDVPSQLQQPKIYESTWAQSVDEYTYVAGDKNETLNVHGETTEEFIYGDSLSSTVTMTGGGNLYNETWNLMGTRGFQEQFYCAFVQTFLGASTTVGVSNRFEMFIGFEEQINLGGTTSAWLGTNVDVGVGVQLTATLLTLEADLQASSASLSEAAVTAAKAAMGLTAVESVLSQCKLGLIEVGTFLHSRR